MYEHLQQVGGDHGTACVYDHRPRPSVLQYDEHLYWSCGTGLPVGSVWKWNAVRFQHRLLNSGRSWSVGHVHDQSDDLNSGCSRMYEHLQQGRDGISSASLYDHRSRSSVLQHDEHIHRSSRDELCVGSVGQWDAVGFEHRLFHPGRSWSVGDVHCELDDRQSE